MFHSYQSFARFRTGPARLRRVGCRPSEPCTTTRAELLPDFFPVLRASSRYFRLASLKLDEDERGGDRSAEIVVTMKTTKGGKVMNPTDAFRKEQRKKELKRNKKERKKVREVGILKKDPESLREQIEKLERMNMKIMGSRAKLAFELRFDNPAYGLIAPALALLLVFRTEACYSRFEEGRKAWTKVIAGSNDLALQVWTIRKIIESSRRNFCSTLSHFCLLSSISVVSSSLPVELPISVRCSLLSFRLQVL